MKILIFFSFFALAFSHPADDKRTLSSVFRATCSQLNGELKNASHECMKERLRLTDNGKKLVLPTVGEILVKTAATLCLGERDVLFITPIERMAASMAKQNISNEMLDCAKLKLSELQPQSDLLEGFNPSGMNSSTDDNCKVLENIERWISGIITNWTKRHQSLNIEMCMAKDMSEVRTNMYRLLVAVKNQPLNVAALNEQKRKMVGNVAREKEDIVMCLIEKLEG
jgi:hypothetical protein